MLGAFPQVAAARQEDILTPSQIFGSSNILQWCHADNAVVSAHEVTTWPDISGNGWDYTPSGAGPTYIDDPNLGGRAALSFDGSTQGMISGLKLQPLSGNTYTAIATFSATIPTFGRNAIFLHGAPTDGAATLTVWTATDGGTGTFMCVSGSDTFGLFSGAHSDTWCLLVATFSNSPGSVLDTLKYGSGAATNNVGATIADPDGRCISALAAARQQVKLRELFYINGRVTPRNLQRLTRYAARDCGPRNLLY